MKLNRILAIILRNLFTFRRNYDRLFDAFYWPIMDLVMWGLTSAYIMQLNPNFSNLVILIVSGLTFWLIVNRSQYETNVSLLEDIWAKNLINIFVSPLKLSEWIIGVLTIGVIKALLSFVTAACIAFIMYKVQLFMFGFYLVPFLLLLLMSGWWVSFFIIGAILRFGTNVQTFAWTLVYILAPFSGILYPITSLPEWIQRISLLLPTTYVFEGIREVITTGHLDSNKLIFSFGLNIIYLAISILFLKNSYKSLQKKGMLQVQ